MQILKCRLTKRTQAKAIKAGIESTMLFDATTRPLKSKECNRYRLDKRYRFILTAMNVEHFGKKLAETSRWW